MWERFSAYVVLLVLLLLLLLLLKRKDDPVWESWYEEQTRACTSTEPSKSQTQKDQNILWDSDLFMEFFYYYILFNSTVVFNVTIWKDDKKLVI